MNLQILVNGVLGATTRPSGMLTSAMNAAVVRAGLGSGGHGGYDGGRGGGRHCEDRVNPICDHRIGARRQSGRVERNGRLKGCDGQREPRSAGLTAKTSI